MARKKKIAATEKRELAVQVLALTVEFIQSFEQDNSDDLSELGQVNNIFERGIDSLYREYTAAEWDKIEEVRSKMIELSEKVLAKKVQAQAEVNGGWIDLELDFEETKSIKVPKNPFLLWALKYHPYEAFGQDLPEWKLVSHSGMKMYNDDPFHTDWVLGAGISLSEAYNHKDGSFGRAVSNAAYAMRHDLVIEFTKSDFSFLAKGREQSYCSGKVCHPGPNQPVKPGSIAIVPHAGPEYQLAMETANQKDSYGEGGLIICETGGKLAHLAIVGREMGCIVLMLPNAMKLYSKFNSVWIDLKKQKINRSGI